MSKYRRARRTRMGQDRNKIVSQLIRLASSSDRIMTKLIEGDRKKAWHLLLTHWLDGTRESVIDRYVDEEAKDVTGYAINIINKELREGKRTYPAITQQTTNVDVKEDTASVTININL